MHVIINVTYEDCIGIINICDKFEAASDYHNKQCNVLGQYTNICRHVAFKPCLEVMRLPTDSQAGYSVECGLYYHLPAQRSKYVYFSNTLLIDAKIKDYLHVTKDRSTLEELLPIVSVFWLYEEDVIPAGHFGVSIIQTNKTLTQRGYSTVILLSNTLSWFAMGYWFRLTESPACQERQVNLLDIDSHQIGTHCGSLRISNGPKVKVSIAEKVFQNYFAFRLSGVRSQFLNSF